MENLLRVGVITATHGIRGEVKVFPTTDDAARFKKLKKCILDTGREKIDMEIESVKFFKQYVILKFKGYDHINDIEQYKKKDLLVTRENAVKLKKNENFIVDLIGLDVVTDEGVHFGTIKDVITGDDGKEYLFPAIKECILDINLEKHEALVHIMPGLLDL